MDEMTQAQQTTIALAQPLAAAAPDISTGQRRAYALDALRGIAILAMVLSGLVPHAVLPSWMYHAQTPPPTHKFDPIPGITWVDLVFPFFLFALGAAIPLALRRRLDKGMPLWQAVLQILKRGFLLGFFSLYQEHLSPYVLSKNPDTATWLTVLLGFALLFPILARLPKNWSTALQWGVRLAGWAGAVALLAWVRYPEGGGFSLGRSNIILVLLTNMAVFGSLVWLITRGQTYGILGALGLYMAMRLSDPQGAGWVHWVMEKTPMPWMFHLSYCGYIFIVGPGLIAGEQLLAWMQEKPAALQQPNTSPGWASGRYAAIVVLMITFVVVNLVGLKARWVPQTVIADLALCAAGMALFANPVGSTQKLLRTFFCSGAYWLILGLVFEPYEGGIKKDGVTMSYYFVTSALALFVLVAFTILIDVWQKRRWVQLLIDNGQNPMIAYVGAEHLIVPLMALAGIRGLFEKLTPGAVRGTLGAIVLTLTVALAVSFLTRRRIFWRT